MLTILVADDHPLVAEGIRHLLQAHGLEVVGTATNGADAVALAAKLRPDVTLLDVVMPQLNGIDALGEIRKQNPAACVLMVSMYSDSERVYRALQAGASGYVLKQDAAETLIDAIRQVTAGGRYLSPGVSNGVVNEYLDKRKPPGALHQLSERERRVLQQLVEGGTAAGIARRLRLSPRTVETYKARLMRKLGLSDLPALVKFAVRHGITPLE